MRFRPPTLIPRRNATYSPIGARVSWESVGSRILTACLVLNLLNTAYLSWRFIALENGWTAPGTGWCSWSEWIDCDQVLRTPQARVFYFPNALLGFGFSLGCVIWWTAGGDLRTLRFWLGVSSAATLWFWWLLIHLDHLCPVCPWHHVLTYGALAAAFSAKSEPIRPRLVLVATCVGQFMLWLALWHFSG